MTTMVGFSVLRQHWKVLRLSKHHGKTASLKLGLSELETERFQKKCRNLALCYLVFTKNASNQQASRSVTAAVCSVAYDVLSDWREMSTENCLKMSGFLGDYVDKSVVPIATGLYEKELVGALEQDGLERGVDALRFIVRVLGSEQYLPFDIVSFGKVCQIVDDVLDAREDYETGALNCLRSGRWRQYLGEMIDEMSGLAFATQSKRAPLFRLAVRHAKRDAKRMLIDPHVNPFFHNPSLVNGKSESSLLQSK